MRREVVEVVTPGAVIDDSLLDLGRNTCVAAIAGDDPIGLATADLSTGEVEVWECDASGLAVAGQGGGPVTLLILDVAEFDQVLGIRRRHVQRHARPGFGDGVVPQASVDVAFQVEQFGAQGLDQHRSLAFRVTYRDPEATLTDKQVDKVHASLAKVARDRFEATIR